jgi:DNA helicase II / ATP-dependent DNA helicase PcrA
VLAEVGEGDREAWLFQLMQAIARPEVPSEIQDVRIMSLHKSKGLSSPVTIVAGCVEGLLPQQPEQGTPYAEAAAMVEEQRRLFFVSISRVKAMPEAGKPGTLILTYSRRMPMADAMQAKIRFARRIGNLAHLNASRFIRELGQHAPQPVAG